MLDELIEDLRYGGMDRGAEIADIIQDQQAELTSLRAFKQACDGQEAVAVVTDVYGLVWYGSGPIAPIVRRNNIKVGSCLYVRPDPEAAELRMRIEELENSSIAYVKQVAAQIKQLEDDRATRDQQVAEACAEAVDRMPLRHAGRADLTANQAVETIRSGEWKKHMKGVE